MEHMMNVMRQQARREGQSAARTKIGVIDTYDPELYTVTAVIQPEGLKTGALPILSVWVGNEWGLFVPPTPGQQCLIMFLEDDPSDGVVMPMYFSDVNKPLTGVKAGEWWLVQQTQEGQGNGKGSWLKFTNDGHININGQVQLDVTIGGDINITTTNGGNINISCAEDTNFEIVGNLSATVGGNATVDVTGDTDIMVEGNTDVTSIGPITVTTSADATVTAAGAITATAGGAITATAGGAIVATAALDASITAAGNASLIAEGSAVVNGAGGVSIHTQGAADVHIQGNVNAVIDGSFSATAASWSFE